MVTFQPSVRALNFERSPPVCCVAIRRRCSPLQGPLTTAIAMSEEPLSLLPKRDQSPLGHSGHRLTIWGNVVSTLRGNLHCGHRKTGFGSNQRLELSFALLRVRAIPRRQALFRSEVCFFASVPSCGCAGVPGVRV